MPCGRSATWMRRPAAASRMRTGRAGGAVVDPFGMAVVAMGERGVVGAVFGALGRSQPASNTIVTRPSPAIFTGVSHIDIRIPPVATGPLLTPQTGVPPHEVARG